MKKINTRSGVRILTAPVIIDPKKLFSFGNKVFHSDLWESNEGLLSYNIPKKILPPLICFQTTDYGVGASFKRTDSTEF